HVSAAKKPLLPQSSGQPGERFVDRLALALHFQRRLPIGGVRTFYEFFSPLVTPRAKADNSDYADASRVFQKIRQKGFAAATGLVLPVLNDAEKASRIGKKE